MVLSAAYWGLGYGALLVAILCFGWSFLRERKTPGTAKSLALTAQILAALGTLGLWIGLLSRALKGHGWPLVSPADMATGIALLMLVLYMIWTLFSQTVGTGFAVATTALLLLSYGLSQYPEAAITTPFTSKGLIASNLLNTFGGSLLALAAAISAVQLYQMYRPPFRSEQHARPERAFGRTSELLVRGALLCLAVSLAIDTWWLQKIGLGSGGDAQQAGIAISWMVYFIALRLRSSARWRGWPWAAVLTVGFICTLPILINAPWLDNTLPI